jgi:hypothetical protein
MTYLEIDGDKSNSKKVCHEKNYYCLVPNVFYFN